MTRSRLRWRRPRLRSGLASFGLASRPRALFVAEQEGEIAGCVLMQKAWELHDAAIQLARECQTLLLSIADAAFAGARLGSKFCLSCTRRSGRTLGTAAHADITF